MEGGFLTRRGTFGMPMESGRGNISPVSATSIYLMALVITNGVFIHSMLIDGCSNIWWGGRSAGESKINIRARSRSKYLRPYKIFDLIKKSMKGSRTCAQTHYPR